MSVGVLRRIRTGIVVALVVGLLGFAYQTRYGDHVPTYNAAFTDAAELVKGNDVRINDVKVGRITSVRLDGLEAKVTFTVADDVTLPGATRAEIRQASLLGDRYVSLFPEGKGRLRPGDTIPSDRTRRAYDTEALISQGAAFAGALTADDLNQMLHAFETAYGDDPERLGRLIDASAASAKTFAEAGDDIAATIDAVEAMAAEIAPRSEELAGSIGKLADGLAAVGDSSGELQQLTTGLDQFSRDLAGLLLANRDRLRTFGADVSQVLDEIVASLPDVAAGVAMLYDFNAAWACIGDGNFINQQFVLLPEAATVDYGPGHCDPEKGQRSTTRDSQLVVEGVDRPVPDDWNQSATERRDGEDRDGNQP